MTVKMENAAFALFIKFQFFINEETIFKAATRVTEEEKDETNDCKGHHFLSKGNKMTFDSPKK